jgi:hypothetical protein
MEDLLFSTPWWLPTFIIGFGAVLWITGNRRTETRLKTIGIIVACLGVLLATVSYLVETDLEQAARKSRDLVRSVVDRNWSKMATLLDENAELSVQDGGTLYHSRDQILDAAKKRIESIGLHSATVYSLDGAKQGPLITTTFSVLSDQDLTGGKLPSSWQIEWRQHGKQWTASDIRALRIGTMTGADARSQFPR